MYDKFCKLFKLIIKNPGLIAVVLILLGFIVLGIGTLYDNEFLKEIGKAIFVSGVFSAFFKGLQAADIFKDDLAKVIYFDEEYLSHRNDIKCIWHKVTKTLHKNSFPTLNDKISNTVIEKYLPTNFEYYYRDMKRHIQIEWYDKSKKLAKITTRIEADIMPNANLNKITDCGGYSGKYIELGNNDKQFKLEYFKINNNEYPNVTLEEKGPEKGEYSCRFKAEIPSSGAAIKFDSEHFVIQNLEQDPLLRFRSKSYIDKLLVDIRHENDIKLSFYGSGTPNEFTNTGLPEANRIRKSYNEDLLFTNQGYIIEAHLL